ncbi:hypothetical protein, partial [Campylobacter coli]|uniref:hypothetical protein n=1 Tax=Campylobacter coli TaxID=195 RepID=UPI00112FAF09
MSFMQDYNKIVEERAALGIPPLPLNAEKTKELCELLTTQNDEKLVYLLHNRDTLVVED